MSDALSRLERRVRGTVERLGELRAERDELAGEVERLRARIAALETAPPAAVANGADWAATRARTIEELRSAIDELRAS